MFFDVQSQNKNKKDEQFEHKKFHDKFFVKFAKNKTNKQKIEISYNKN